MISLGLDCGTQSTKCVALDGRTGAILARAQSSHELLAGLPPGSAEQNPADWVRAAGETIAAVLARLGTRKDEIRCLGVSGQQHGLVVLDAADAVIRPAKLWCDTSTVEQCRQITETLGGEQAAIEETGNAILPGYTAPKILWIKQHEPDNYARIRSVLLPHDYLNFWLTGEKRMEFGDASGTALLRVRERVWSEKAVAAIGPELADWLPQLGSSIRATGLVRGPLLEQWGLKRSVTVSAGGGDNMMGAIGTGNVGPGVVTASLGTSGTLYAFSTSPVVDAGGEVAAFCDSTDHWLPLVCTMNVTLVTEAVSRLFGWDHLALDRAAAAAQPGSGGLRLLPYFSGERTPNLPRAAGVWTGWNTGNTTPANVARAAIEGVTLGLAYGLARLRSLGMNPSEIRLTGGGSNSPFWRQLCADVFGAPTVCLQNNEGAALGAATQALWTEARENGSDASLQDLTERVACCDEATRAMPDPQRHALYQQHLEQSTVLRRTLAAAGLL